MKTTAFSRTAQKQLFTFNLIYMKNKLTLDWKEYYLVPVEEQDDVGKCWEKQELDKYKKIRKSVERGGLFLSIRWEKKELVSFGCWNISLIPKQDYIDSYELHFEECTLWDLKENDVFVIKTRIYIAVKESDRYFVVNYLNDDIISREWFSKNDTPVIKILRH